MQLPAIFVQAMPLEILHASSVPKLKASFCAISASPALFCRARVFPVQLLRIGQIVLHVIALVSAGFLQLVQVALL